MQIALAALVLGLTVGTLPVTAQQGSPASPATRVSRAVDANVLRAHLGFLADDALEGRAPGTR
ncbi:MAG: peptidase M28, partial [Gemmatimonadales bacterium]